MKKNILLVYAGAAFPMRATAWEHFRSFRNYSEENTYYLNLILKKVPWYVSHVDFDLIIFHTLFLTKRWVSRESFSKVVRKAEPLKRSRAVKVILPQDEFIHSDLLCEFINEFGIDYVFSVAPETEWASIYPTVDFNKVKFYRVLTGYLDDQKLAETVAVGKSIQNRPIDIGYRTAGETFFWFGRHGFLKQQIAELFQDMAPKKGIVVDISIRKEDKILGDTWYRFLSQCKYTIGVEGGTSMIDRDGSIQEQTERYLALHPQANFAEVEAACFPGVDGLVKLYALSPRHLEACATRTCQVLTEGDYNGILKPGRHYIELKKDFSNIEQVLGIMVQDRLRSEIVERAYQDIVASGQYTYRHFVKFVIRQSLNGSAPKRMPNWILVWNRIVYYSMYIEEAIEWLGFRLFYPLIRSYIRK